MKKKKHACSILIVWIIAIAGSAQAGTLDKVFRFLGNARWGADQKHFVSSLGKQTITFTTNNLLSIPANLGKFEGSMNYLFNKEGKFYCLAWYAAIPVAAMQDVQELESQMEEELRVKYGEPVYAFSDGDASKAAEVVARGGITYQDAAKMLGKPGGLPKDAEGNVDIKQMMMMMPGIFYSKLNFWEGSAVWVYTNLLCSTDGTCYVHLQFVSKKMVSGEKYLPTPGVPFSYSPLDRDQDLVTKAHRAWGEQSVK